jgi:hypothetical protein
MREKSRWIHRLCVKMYTVYAWKTCGILAGMWIPLANFGDRSVWVSEELSAAWPQRPI